jgi:hypothetical protein
MNTLKLKTDLRCGACVQGITPLLDAEPGIRTWSANVTSPDKILTVEGEGITTARINTLINEKGYHVLAELPANQNEAAASRPVPEPTPTSYYPILLIFAYLLAVVGAFEYSADGFVLDRAMRHFMAGFFLVFSFFKLLDVSAFAMSYSSYDIVARRWSAYGFIYPFIELALGLAYLTNAQPWITNFATLVVMGVSTIGVVQSLLARRKIRCACLGAIFNLPMSSITLIEDLLMVGMAIAMLVITRHGT